MAKTDPIISKSKHKIERKGRIGQRLKRVRNCVAVFSFVLFVICLYFIYSSFTTETIEFSVSDIQWRLTIIIKLLVALFGYVGAIIQSKRFLIVTMAFILADIVLTFGLYFMSYTNLDSQYDQHLVYLAKMQNRTEEFNNKDCDFIKVFRREIIQNLILVSFHVIYADSILNLIHWKEKLVLGRELPVKPSPKWPLILLSIFHLFYSIYLFWSKTFRNDRREEIIQKKGFVYILLWTIIAFLSIFISIVSPFAFIKVEYKDMFFLNFFISTVILSTFVGSAKFLLIVAEEFWNNNPKNDFYCNIRLTSVDDFGSILILLIINKIIISLILTLSHQIVKEFKHSKAVKNIDKSP